VQRAACCCPAYLSMSACLVRIRLYPQQNLLNIWPRPRGLDRFLQPTTAITGVPPASVVCGWPLHARSKRHERRLADLLLLCSRAESPRAQGVPSRLLPSLATTGQGFTPRGGHARPFRSRDRCYLTVLLTRRLHSSSRDDKVVDDNAEICGTGEPHRSRSLP
jgi:hypothetical protein